MRTSESETDDGRHPQDRRGRQSDDELGPPKDRSATEKADAGENTEWSLSATSSQPSSIGIEHMFCKSDTHLGTGASLASGSRMNDSPTTSAVRHAASDVAELVRDELTLARHELSENVEAVRPPLLACAAGLLSAVVGAGVLMNVIAVEYPRRAAVVGVLALLGGATLFVLGARSMPRQFLSGTRARLRADARLAEAVMP